MGVAPLESLRRRLVDRIEAEVGRHDELELYGGEPGDRGLTGGPGSMSWELHGDLASLFLAGPGAIVMELLHPSVMAGVAAHSSYREEPVRRARATLGYVLRTTFGNTRSALRVIDAVKRMHARVVGVRSDGVAYAALDPELIGWVHTCIPWAVMTAYDRYVRRLSTSEKDRYLREQAHIGRLGGATWVPESVAELEAYVLRMRPTLAASPELLELLRYMDGDGDPRSTTRGDRAQRWVSLRSSMALLPRWARRMTCTDQPAAVGALCLDPAARLTARMVRFAYPILPCKAIALARVASRTAEQSDMLRA
jgi:uncharacterized protein (DUF2236 family)